jgi:uncharacterized integral membrane protein
MVIASIVLLYVVGVIAFPIICGATGFGTDTDNEKVNYLWASLIWPLFLAVVVAFFIGLVLFVISQCLKFIGFRLIKFGDKLRG